MALISPAASHAVGWVALRRLSLAAMRHGVDRAKTTRTLTTLMIRCSSDAHWSTATQTPRNPSCVQVRASFPAQYRAFARGLRILDPLAQRGSAARQGDAPAAGVAAPVAVLATVLVSGVLKQDMESGSALYRTALSPAFQSAKEMEVV
jgi:hypothetical protein